MIDNQILNNKCLCYKNYTKEQLSECIKSMVFIQKYFKRKFNRLIFPFYGSLLGTVREKDFIKNDCDIDMMWFCPYTQQIDIMSDYDRIIKQLKKDSLFKSLGRYWTGQFRMRLSKHNNTVIDTYSCFCLNKHIHIVPHGKVGTLSDFFPLKNNIMHQRNILIPNNSEKILTVLYGNWKESKQDKAKNHIKFVNIFKGWPKFNYNIYASNQK